MRHESSISSENLLLPEKWSSQQYVPDMNYDVAWPTTQCFIDRSWFEELDCIGFWVHFCQNQIGMSNQLMEKVPALQKTCWLLLQTNLRKMRKIFPKQCENQRRLYWVSLKLVYENSSPTILYWGNFLVLCVLYKTILDMRPSNIKCIATPIHQAMVELVYKVG